MKVCLLLRFAVYRALPVMLFVFSAVSVCACHDTDSYIVEDAPQYTCQPVCAHLQSCDTLHYLAGATNILECEALCVESIEMVEIKISECVTAHDALTECISALSECVDIDKYFNGDPSEEIYPCVKEEIAYYNCEVEYSEGFFTLAISSPHPAAQ